MKVTLDLDIVMCDFADAFRECPHAALSALHTLLLNKTLCQARIEFLRQAEEQADQDIPEWRTGRLPCNFEREIQLLASIGPLEGERRGLLVKDRLAALTRDPDGLWKAHVAVNAAIAADPQGGRETGPTALVGETVAATSEARVGLTTLAMSGQTDELRRRLEPWAPFLLRRVGLNSDLAEALVQFIVRRIGQVAHTPGGRFGELVPGWLEEFAGEQDQLAVFRPMRKAEDLRETIEQGAVQLALKDSPPGEAEWAVEFRRRALDANVASFHELLRVEPIDVPAPVDDVAWFRRELMTQIEKVQTDGIHLFEQN